MNRAVGKGPFCSQKFHAPVFICLDYLLIGFGFKNISIALFPCIGQISCISLLFQSALIIKPNCAKFSLKDIECKPHVFLILAFMCSWAHLTLKFLLESRVVLASRAAPLKETKFWALLHNHSLRKQKKFSSALDMDPLTWKATWLTRKENAFCVM